MQKLTLVICISVSLLSCKQNTFEKNVIELELKYKHQDSIHMLYTIYKNVSSKPVYIPNLASSVLQSHYYMKIYNGEGKIIKGKFFLNESQYLTALYKNPSELEEALANCPSGYITRSYSDLTNKSLGENRQLLKKLIDKEYQQILKANSINENVLSEEEKETIKDALEFKYPDPLFLKPGEQHTHCSTVNTLVNNSEKSLIYINYEPFIRKSKYYKVHITPLKDSLKIPLKMKDSVMGYHLYNRAFSSDTIAFN